jgi:anti-sigma B factor antagonist
MHDTELSITVEGEQILVKLRGEIDMETAPQLDSCLANLKGTVTVECSGLDFLDSTGIRIFVEAHKAFHDRGDRLFLRNVPPHIRRVFDLTGVAEFLGLD